VPAFTASAVQAANRVVSRTGASLDRYDRLGPMLLAAVVSVLAGLTEVGFEALLRFSD
jgi:hypothetical protein